MDGLFNYQTPMASQQQFLKDRLLTNPQMAQLPLLNQVAAMGMNPGTLLGTGVGRMFGGRTSAEVENETMKEIFAGASAQTEDPVERMTIAAQGLRQRGLEGRAIQLEQEAAKLQQTRAATRKTEAETEREANRIRNAAQFVQGRLPELSIEQAEAIATDEQAVRKLLETPKVDTQVVETADGQMLINKRTGEILANIGPSPRQGTNVEVNVDTRGASSALKLVSDFDSAVKEPLEAHRSAQMAKTLINEAIGSNNSQAWEQARTLVAKSTGRGRLSNEDIRRTGVDPRFVQGVADWFNKKTVGVPNEDIQRQLYVVATHLERQTGNTINQTAQRARSVAEMEGVDPAKLDTFFPGVPVNNSPRRQGAGGGNTVNWSDLQ